MKNAKLVIPQKVLAVHLITRSSISTASKEKILTKVNTEEYENLYNSVVKVMRELKTLAPNETGKEPENRTFHAHGESSYHSTSRQVKPFFSKGGRESRLKSRYRYNNRPNNSNYNDGNWRNKNEYSGGISQRHDSGRKISKDRKSSCDYYKTRNSHRESSKNLKSYRDFSRNRRSSRDTSRSRKFSRDSSFRSQRDDSASTTRR